jgi:galactokinase
MKAQLIAQFRAIFGREPEFVTHAPGRIEFIGNHTDYNGGTVLGASIDRGVWVGYASRSDRMRQFFSPFNPEKIAVPVGELTKQSGEKSWINYPLGVLAALPVFDLHEPDGFDFLALSDLPAGAGLSSSAALELSSALAFLAATKQEPSRETVVLVGKHAENRFVGVPCGILDQGVSGFGQKNSLVFIDCRGPKFASVPLPEDAHFWIFNTHTKHALVDGLYAARHRECMEAAKTLGVSLLADTDGAHLESSRAQLSPDAYKRAKHILEEIVRVDRTVEALRAKDLDTVGKLLTASHRSSQHLFENSTSELDFLVDALTALPAVYGARLSGGGFGGAVMALTNSRFSLADAEGVAAAYTKKFGAKPEIIHCQTGEGAALVP